MKHPIEFNLEKQFPDARKRNGVPPDFTYNIPYAVKVYWLHPNFRLSQQDYDGKDVYTNLIQIKNKKKFSIIIEILTIDLFWLFVKKGNIHIELLDDDGNTVAFINQLNKKEYAVYYSSPKRYRITFEPDEHILYFFVVDARWLKRSPVIGPENYKKLIQLLKQQEDTHHSSPVLELHDAIDTELLHLFTLPTFEEMEMDTKVYSPIVRIVIRSRNDLDEKNEEENSEQTKQFLISIREYCEQQISWGNMPLIKDIAEHFNRSRQYIYRIHKREYGESLQDFLTLRQLELAREQVLHTDKDFTTIAYNFGFTDLQHFIKQYQKHFGISPSEDR